MEFCMIGTFRSVLEQHEVDTHNALLAVRAALLHDDEFSSEESLAFRACEERLAKLHAFIEERLA